jgi:uncharacterized damage-inducible protein DinB
MYRTINDFSADWKYESEMTGKIFDKLTNGSLGQRVDPGGRTLGYLAWHIIVSLGMATEAGLPFKAPDDSSGTQPSDSATIKSVYEKSTRELITAVSQNWKDANLLEKVQMYGMTWTRGYALLAMVKHQTHHRAQMTVLMRQAGLIVPGAYGPAREEWAAMGMEAQP